MAWPQPWLQQGDSLFWSRHCWPELRGSTWWVCKSFQLSWAGRTSQLYQVKNKLHFCMHLNRDWVMVCFRRSPVTTSLGLYLPWSWDTAGVAHIWNQQLVGMQHDLESLKTEFPFHVKLASRRTTAVYFLYTLCNFHAHLMRLLGNTISYENSEGWRLLFLFRRQACMLLS